MLDGVVRNQNINRLFGLGEFPVVGGFRVVSVIGVQASTSRHRIQSRARDRESRKGQDAYRGNMNGSGIEKCCVVSRFQRELSMMQTESDDRP